MFSGVSGIGSGNSSGGRPTGRLGRDSFAAFLEFFGFGLEVTSTPHYPHFTSVTGAESTVTGRGGLCKEGWVVARSFYAVLWGVVVGERKPDWVCVD